MWKKAKVNWKTVLKQTFNRRGASEEDNWPEKIFLKLQGSNQSTQKTLDGIEARPEKYATSEASGEKLKGRRMQAVMEK